MTSLLVLALLGVFSVGLVYIVQNEARLTSTDMGSGQAYYGASAGMEKMVVDLNNLIARQTDTVAAIEGLGDAAYEPSLTGVAYTDYTVSVPNTGGVPNIETRNISAGPNQGMMASITPVQMTVTAEGTGGDLVRMDRKVEYASIPLFQFALFSNGDLSITPAVALAVGGRVHANGNMFLASGSTSGLTLHARVTAAGEIIRSELVNGVSTSAAGLSLAVRLPTAPRGCEGSAPACRSLATSEGSQTSGPGSSDNPSWADLSESTYRGSILSGDTGAKAVNPLFVGAARPVELIRRPPGGESPDSAVGQARLYNKAQVRVLMSDDPLELPGGVGVQLANVAPYLQGGLYGATDTAFAQEAVMAMTIPENPPWSEDPVRVASLDSHPAPALEELSFGHGGMMLPPQGKGGGPPPGKGGAPPPGKGGAPPPGKGGGPGGGGTVPGADMIDGYLLVQARQSDGSYTDVTMEWLDLGIARENANAILRFQGLKDLDGDGVVDIANTAANRQDPTNFFPLNLYDSREGEPRDGTGATSCAVGGVMNIVELDVANLRQWLLGSIGASGISVENTSQTGYLLYYSDRRGMQANGSGVKTGEYGYEDVVNPTDPAGLPNASLDGAEDLNANGVLDSFGAANVGDGFAVPNGDPTVRVDCVNVARTNRVSGARRGLRLVNGSVGNLPTRADGTGGFTVAGENPVYIQGDYNADSLGFSAGWAPAAVIADAVTFLSNSWGDHLSFQSPALASGRAAATTYYRLAVVTGRSLSWTKPTWSSNNNDGLDGPSLHLVRSLEQWSGGATLNHLGSIATLFNSEYAVGTYKCCTSVLSIAGQNFSFDIDFRDLNRLPPATPLLSDVVSLGFRQIF